MTRELSKENNSVGENTKAPSQPVIENGLTLPTIAPQQTSLNNIAQSIARIPSPSIQRQLFSHYVQQQNNSNTFANKLARRFSQVQRQKSTTAGKGVVQRQIYLYIDKENFISTKRDEKRPSGSVSRGKQGDHTTPFTTLQAQIANAIEGVSLSDAWENLADTFEVYKTLPGWEESTKWVTNNLADYVENLLSSKGNVNALQECVDWMLTLRNQMALTSLPKGGSGKGEGKWAGSLQYQERQFQLGNTPSLAKNLVIEYMWKAFDHERVDRLNKSKKKAILLQHAVTMADAYPLVSESVGLDYQDIINYYSKRDWLNYTPPG